VNDPPAASNADEDRRSPIKRQAIIQAATTLFLRAGYAGTTMDEIATLAGVSKVTVYNHFADKERLFSEIVIATVDEISDPNYTDVLNLADSGDLETDLTNLARRQLARVMQPHLLQLRRLVIGEATRFPHLSQIFYDRGPARTINALSGAFERLADQNKLHLTDPHLAAAHFNWLVMSIPLNDAMLLGHDTPPPHNELNRYADAGVQTFLAAYSPPRPHAARSGSEAERADNI
jgi:TetR/AcrR family transcriptional regulator, mexJK operon transcriptional repressor